MKQKQEEIYLSLASDVDVKKYKFPSHAELKIPDQQFVIFLNFIKTLVS